MILKNYLMLGINTTILVLSVTSCKKEVINEYPNTAEYVYLNSTPHKIKLWNGDFELEENKSYTLKINGDGDENINEKSFVSPYNYAVILYDNILCDTVFYENNNSDGITNIKNYTNEKLGERHYKFTYIFTNDDYLKADSCK